MTNEWELKKQIVEIGRRIWTRGYVAANDGNITVLLNENELLTTPTGVSKGFMTVDMIIKCDRTGKVKGEPVEAVATILDDAHIETVYAAIGNRYGLLGKVFNFFSKLRGGAKRNVGLELRAA